MINPARKRSTLVIIVIVIVILSGAILIQFGGRIGSSVQSGTATSNSSSSLTQTNAPSSSSSVHQSPALVVFGIRGVGGQGQAYDQLLATPGATMNYTVTISQIDKTVSHVALSATSTVPGLTLVLNPKEITFLGSLEGATLEISVDPSVSSPTLPIELIATTPQGATNASFSFKLENELIVIWPGVNGLVKPITLHASVGQTVKWLDLIQEDDDAGTGYTNIKLADGSAASPTMAQYDFWSHTFDRPGTYTYRVVSSGSPDSYGTVVVSQ